MDKTRRRTLETLVELAEGNDPVGCWDPARAIELLRGEATLEELRDLGVDAWLIEEVWPSQDGENK